MVGSFVRCQDIHIAERCKANAIIIESIDSPSEVEAVVERVQCVLAIEVKGVATTWYEKKRADVSNLRLHPRMLIFAPLSYPWPLMFAKDNFRFSSYGSVGSLEPATSTRPDPPPRTRRTREERGSRDVVKTTLYYITRRGLKGPCRVTFGRSPSLTVKENSLRCGSFQ
ncbi:hypothetical protein AVEN_4570-1 [Araneus ventricosus]|uniref:Uncharacterized protein n=1 Tax=Araneus ventricosus TaxID=182803 RepID=A0A4Y2VPF9_ARAVE|nr:hypothetical protein AVEN_4570-1 [Araneus ventricosus]